MITDETGVGAVVRIAQQEGLSRYMRLNVTPELIDQVFALKNQGQSTQEIADALKITKARVYDIAANVNSETYKRAWWDTTPEKRMAAIQQLDNGKVPNDVARDLDLPRETILGIANQHRMARDTLARELLAQGKSAKDVARSLGMRQDYVERLTQGVPAGTHDIHLVQNGRDRAMDMFEKGYGRQEVASKLGISPWEAQSLANDFRKKIMDSVTPQQLNDIVRAFGDKDYMFGTGDLVGATGLPESTIRVIEQEYVNGSFKSTLAAGPSRVEGEVREYEWVAPLSPDQEAQAIHLLGQGQNFEAVADQLGQPEQAIERLFEDEDLPLLALQDDAIASPTAIPNQATGVISEDDKVRIRLLEKNTGVSVSFIADLYETSADEIRKILDQSPAV